MSGTDISPYLDRLSAFKGVDEKERRALSAVLRLRRFAEREELCVAGEPGRSCFFVVSGEVEVEITLPGIGKRTLATLRDDAVIGQVALVDAGPRSATCRATKPTVVLELGRQDFDTLFSSGSVFAMRFQHAVARNAAQQLREANRRLTLLIDSQRRPSQQQRKEVLAEVQELLAKADSETSSAIRWID